MTTVNTKDMKLPIWVPGDLNAFFGLGINSLTNLLVLSGLLVGVIQMPPEIVFGRIVPAVGFMLVYYHGEWRRNVPPADHRINVQAAEVSTKSPVPSGVESPEAGRLLLYVYPELTLTTRSAGSLPYLQDLGSPLWQMSWVTSAELNPKTAAHLGLTQGDSIKIKNDRGEVPARVRLSPGIRPDVIAVHSGGGRVHGGRYAAGIGSNPLRLIKTEPGTDLRRVRREPTLVRIELLA